MGTMVSNMFKLHVIRPDVEYCIEIHKYCLIVDCLWLIAGDDDADYDDDKDENNDDDDGDNSDCNVHIIIMMIMLII